MEKLYYSISEVSEILGVTQSNLRFWEKEFKQLKPRRNTKGTRFYTQVDIDMLRNIMFLVNDQRLTLEGAKRRLGQQRDVVEKQQKLADKLRKLKTELKALSSELGK
ncbi:MAG: MerR family transcriptional regulator [Paludibacteraceae bacterium]|nr:MerR family transcriptional regulator [Paludibacteraceae bacterium]